MFNKLTLVQTFLHTLEHNTKFNYLTIGIITSLLCVNFASYIEHPIIYYDSGHTIQPFLKSCDVSKLPDMRGPLRYYDICFSYKILGNERIIPALSSFGLLVMAFLYVRKITGSGIIGLVAFETLAVSNSFNMFGFTATYPQTWALMLISTLYLINTRYKYLAPIPYVLGLFSHGLILLDFPIVLYQLLLVKQKYLMIVFLAIVGAVVLYTLTGGNLITNGGQLAFNALPTFEDELQQFRADYLLYCLIPVCFGLLLWHRSKTGYFILFGLAYLIAQIFLLDHLTNLGQEYYRLLPLIVFMGVALGYGIRNTIKAVVSHSI